ncbi:hypothetical protein Stsp02_44280 [Streptomyces sp. NBRC 14336]|uniref:2OG-Fe(II) oxygenase n=1 Tax=Streptomyces sp. NBRC 14336 TaxID=3030992 RepID=UPI0024A2EA43|nr:2OG-Fe(II) oxygenase [Streptomyces sp. NBRC 14336]WBO81582.1 2OG-Fe(II) oxygenase [Streptomyces sp. SBE_14.2]GLW48766.1 hypothetical protein Stsp02_44280 [Streptomyces sp. NBRC 14336]
MSSTLESLVTEGSARTPEVRGVAVTATAPVCVVPHFLGPAQAHEVMSWALADVSGLQTATTLDGPPDTRRAKVLYTLVPPSLGRALVNVLPTVEKVLGVTAAERRVECQVTVHGDGDYFRRHLDVGEGDAASRRISFIYYLHRSPRLFSGGQLRVYDSVSAPGKFSPAASFRDVEPIHDTIVFFPSASVFHEVLPVSCSSARPEDGRVTCNGWIH